MIEIKDTCYKGTRILLGHEKRYAVNIMVQHLLSNNYQEISIPIIQAQETFSGKVGEENNNLMFNFKDRGDRDVCLAPEYTAVIQKLSTEYFKYKNDVKLFYVQECFRGEKPQAGRYRQFTQLGVEIINPTKDYQDELILLSSALLDKLNIDYRIDKDATRGLDYYKGGKGFEIRNKDGLQLLGGGEYEGGIGFALGIDRLL